MNNDRIREQAKEAKELLAQDKENLFDGNLRYAAEYVFLRDIRESYEKAMLSRAQVLRFVDMIVNFEE